MHNNSKATEVLPVVVATPKSPEDDILSDMASMADGFRRANDEDTCLALNAISSKSEIAMADLSYYVMPTSWMRAAWDVFMPTPAAHSFGAGPQPQPQPSRGAPLSENWREHLGPVGVSRLLNTSPPPPRLFPNVDHVRDYVLVGPNLWLLLKEKFGADGELRLPVTVLPGGSRCNESGLAVRASGSQLVEIPATGRFPYERFFGTTHRRREEDDVDHDEVMGGDDPASADNENWAGSPSNPWRTNSTGPQFEHVKSVRLPGNVSDDDDNDETDSLIPQPDDTQSRDDDRERLAPSPVFLLPMSTTYATPAAAQYVGSNRTLRPHGSGLGNLGNTCFMNSTLQCLAHTGPLRRYFLSGAFRQDLNTKNPLGTAGDLAIQFAQLLAEMWVSTDDYPTKSNVVYPRSFKFALGRHADQFVGYDQHDSQELATYLLDALHEDTNRVTVKPYIEKPEQEEGESDEHASAKAWELHEKREDSYIHRLFVGQIKSRIQCCREGCGRVSTTFDPFQFLSLPIPGSSERNIKVRFVPLDPKLRAQDVTIRIEKVAPVRDLVTKTLEQLEGLGIVSNLGMNDVLAADVWNKDVYEVLELSSSVERIRDNDETYVFQLAPEEDAESSVASKERELELEADLGMRGRPTPMRFTLDESTRARLDRGDAWATELSKYLRNPSGFSTAFNPNRGKVEERVKLFNRLCTFINQCYQDCEGDTYDENQPGSASIIVSADEDAVQGIRERSESSSYFDRVERKFDVAVLEFVASKMREEIHRMERARSLKSKSSAIVYIRMRKQGFGQRFDKPFVTAFPLRISSDTTVYKLRLDLATRLARYLRSSDAPSSRTSSGEPSSERPATLSYDAAAFAPGTAFGTPEQLLIRQIPLTYERKSAATTAPRSAPRFVMQLGCLEKSVYSTVASADRPVALASPKNDKEAELVADVVGDGGIIHLEWPEELAERHFDDSEFEAGDNHTSTNAGASAEAALDIYECIDKYCQREQLEESDMWYCNRCKELVRAWKQFQLYRSPPILIVHLKRFHYSATTHRRDKITTFIDFPLQGLDLSSRFAHWADGEKPVYDCYAVSNHYGGLGGGHYTAYALNDDGTWCYYDDSRVTTDVNASEVVSEAAYVLYYRRQDVTVEDFSVSLTASAHSSPASIGPASISSQDGLFRDATAAVVDEDDGMDVDVVRQPRDADVNSTGTSSIGSRDDYHSMDEPMRVGGKKRGNMHGASDDIFPLQ